MVLRRDETSAGHTHKYAMVVKVHHREEGMVRSTDIKYKVPGERSSE
jgi:hypothetical protein